VTSLAAKKRKTYSIKSLFIDLKKISPTPRALHKVGAELIYSEWNTSVAAYGSDHIISRNLNDLLQFMETDYETIVLNGDLTTVKDTPSSVLTQFLKDRPTEFLEHKIGRSPDYVYNIIKVASKICKDEAAQCKSIESGIRKQMKDEPEDFGHWNQLRILLWLQGKYKEAAEALREAKKLGWAPEKSAIVSII